MLVIAFLGTVCLTLAGIGAYAWSRLRSRKVQQRLQRVASLLSGEDVEQAPEAEESIFRAVESESWFARLRTSIETRYPLLDARRALPRALAICLLVSAVVWLSMWFLRVPQGWWTIPIIGIVGAVATWYALSWFHERQVTEFVRQLPEVVDQIVRLSAAGVPPVEAIAVVADDSRQPVKPILSSVRDRLIAGLSADIALQTVSENIRVAEFTLFAAVIRLQQRSGGGISAAFSNLATTLRERHGTALKVRAATAQTRLTLLILALLPGMVLLSQKFIAPQSVEILFNTEQGTTMLRWGTGIIVLGLLVARGIGKRCER